MWSIKDNDAGCQKIAHTFGLKASRVFAQADNHLCEFTHLSRTGHREDASLRKMLAQSARRTWRMQEREKEQLREALEEQRDEEEQRELVIEDRGACSPGDPGTSMFTCVFLCVCV